jgi:hypothetical protein
MVAPSGAARAGARRIAYDARVLLLDERIRADGARARTWAAPAPPASSRSPRSTA